MIGSFGALHFGHVGCYASGEKEAKITKISQGAKKIACVACVFCGLLRTLQALFSFWPRENWGERKMEKAKKFSSMLNSLRKRVLRSLRTKQQKIHLNVEGQLFL